MTLKTWIHFIGAISDLLARSGRLIDASDREEQQLATNTDFTGESPLDYSPDSSSFSSPELPSPRSLMASISEMVDSPGYLYHSIRRVGPPTQTSFPEEEDEKRQSLVSLPSIFQAEFLYNRPGRK